MVVDGSITGEVVEGIVAEDGQSKKLTGGTVLQKVKKTYSLISM